MLWAVAAILLVLWFLGLLFRAFAGVINVLLVVVLLIVIYRLLTGRRTP